MFGLGGGEGGVSYFQGGGVGKEEGGRREGRRGIPVVLQSPL